MAHLILEVCRRHWRWIALSLAFWIAVSIHFRSDIYFFSDIARDFLLVEEVAFRHDIALIGARASIPGVFHGPAWTYLHVPLAVLSEGNPMAVHTFWFFLVLSSVILATVVAQRWFGHFAAWLVAVLLFLRLPLQSSALLNPFGATFGVIGLFWSWIEYTRYQNWRWLAAAFLCVGITIQFQMALGGPLLLLLAGAAAWKIVKTRQWKHVLSTVFLALPLSTFALFELKHGFPQVRGVLAFVSGAEDHGKMALFDLLQNRAIGVVTGHGLLEQLPPAALALIGLFFLWTLALLWKRGHELEKKISWWYLYFYGGFWLFSLLYGGIA